MTGMRLLPLLLALGATPLAGQQSPDARWLPWLGCWQVGETAEPGTPLVCVRPASDPLGVAVSTLVPGQPATSRELIADGRPRDVAFDDCTGSQVVHFSADGHRVYLRSALTCEGGRQQTISGIIAMAPPTTWLDVQSTVVDGELVPRVIRYHPAPQETWPEEFHLSPGQSDKVAGARVLAAGAVALADIAEASTQADSVALATFLVERQQPFHLTAAGLETLDRAGVPHAVIDAMVAVSYPGRFAVAREEPQPTVPGAAVAPGAPAVEPYRPLYPYYDWERWGYWPCPLGLYCDHSYVPDPYRRRRYEVLAYGPSFSVGNVGRPLITDRTVPLQGRAVGGRGYTRFGARGGSGSYAQPRTGSAGGGWAWSPGYSSSGSQGGGSTGRASSGGYSRGGSSSSGGASGTATTRRHD